MTDVIIIKEIEFNKTALCAMSIKINKLFTEEAKTEEAKTEEAIDLSDKISPRITKSGLELLKQYIDHHKSNIDNEKLVHMKPLKPNLYNSVDDVFKEFDIWDGEYIKNMTPEQRIVIKYIAIELELMALIDKLCIYIAYSMIKTLSKTSIESLNEEKMVKIFKEDLNIDLPNIIKKETAPE